MVPAQERILKKVLKECFWGDYQINLEDAEKRIELNDIEFINFFVSRILENSMFASSRLIGIFERDRIRELLSAYHGSSRLAKQAALARAAIFGIPPGGVHEWPNP